MLFNSPSFLFVFLPVAMLAALLPNGRPRIYGLLTISCIFYLWSEPRFFWVALASTFFDLFAVQRMNEAKSRPLARFWLTAAVVSNIGILFYYKYLIFFSHGFNTLLEAVGATSRVSILHIALPIAVSFIVFEKITYIVDVWRGRAKPEHRYLYYMTYVFLFPKLMAGPIIKYHEIDYQLHTVREDRRWINMRAGLQRFMLGVFKKVILADTLAEVADKVFAVPNDQIGFSSAWLGTLFFALQIYLDFSSYSDMAIGLARMYGFTLRENFNYPYVSQNITEFWRRWHISLSTWIKEYLYIPLGGNRGGVARMYINLCICFLLSGLWHGANWTFVVWGLFHGIFLVLDKAFWIKTSRHLPPVFNVLLTFFLVCISWVFFRATSFEQAWAFLGAMFDPTSVGRAIYITWNCWAALAVGIAILVVPIFPAYWQSRKSRAAIAMVRYAAPTLLLIGWMFAVGKELTVASTPFLYFRF
jgi:alginate O-acetyltransferase complex protein AlgI